MSQDKYNFKLIKENNRSYFLNDLLENEYSELVNNNSFIEEHLHINSVYMVENEYEYEVGIYITNNSTKDILLKDIPVSIKSDNNIIEKLISVEKEIKSKEAIFLDVVFNKEEFKEKIDMNSCEVEFGNTRLLNKFNYIKIDFEGLDKVREKLGYRQLKKFIKNLPIIDEDNIALDVFASGEIEEGFFIIISLRNTSKEDVKIKSIPFEIYTEDDLLLYKENFIPSDAGINIPNHSGIFKVILIPKNKFPQIKGTDSNKYKVYIR